MARIPNHNRDTVTHTVHDPRWGRIEEVPSPECPFTTSAYAIAFVHHMQYNKLDPTRLRVSSCCKHFDAYSLDRWYEYSRHTFNAIVSKKDLYDTHFPAFEACAHKDGAAASGVMCA